MTSPSISTISSACIFCFFFRFSFHVSGTTVYLHFRLGRRCGGIILVFLGAMTWSFSFALSFPLFLHGPLYEGLGHIFWASLVVFGSVFSPFSSSPVRLDGVYF
ncbi:hypothetical protein P168DRAFT_34937 [Aspergillus campestris IBT 28561]|uniref:Uncharacterized protein n=1 Tax=Aspergillus campestris (strain IBT 28561) TaxID=1392248 RepID=A0A2I1DHJ0_ASPC2|nr:uncharacterized protein P168DRAFT_34937 [Aspergillus campestris IBT 28561]PKY09344.1 hypothetical protein P168DRAFT_34937 [Aspergillus campestris IBT 28561]